MWNRCIKISNDRIIALSYWSLCIFTYSNRNFQQDCEYDSLALSSKMGSGEIRRHGVFCGSRLPPIITSEGNSLRIEFLSDNSVQKSGFAAVFFTGIPDIYIAYYLGIQI